MNRKDDREPGEIFSRKTQWGTLAFIAILLGGGPLLAWVLAATIGLQRASDGDALGHGLLLLGSLSICAWIGWRTKRWIDPD
jgi:hypothetical protein